MDQTTCERLLNLSFEIEGLVMLLRERADCAPNEVLPLLRDKVAELNRLAGNATDADSERQSQPATEPAPQPEAEEETEEAQSEAIAEASAPEEAEKAADEEAADEAAVVASAEYEEISDTDISLQPSLFDAPESVERIDARLARESARDIHRALTINDRFRFKRELFGNSDAQLNDALDVIAAMNSYDEAEDYFYNDLVWDKDSEDVKDFMNVVANHFGNVR